MYHRVIPRAQALEESEEPGMYVTPDTFAKHLGWLRECLEIVRLGDWVRRAAAGEPLPARACAITFDDGWRDNFEYAFPLLAEHGTPATVFMVSGFAGAAMPFWPNRLARLLAERGEVLAQEPALTWLHELARGVPGGLLAAASNPEVRSQLVRLCKRHPDAWLVDRIEAAERSSSLPPQEKRSMLDWEEVRAMVASGLIDIGSHTRSHTRLRANLLMDLLRAEIVDSRKDIQRETQRPVELFCYPNGDYTAEAANLVAKTYSAAVTTERGINRLGAPLNRLKRLGMHEDISQDRIGFRARLSGWA